MHFHRTFPALAALFALCTAQQVGTAKPEVHPSIAIRRCTKSGGCVVQPSKVVLDANWRWLHSVNSTDNSCFNGQDWDPNLCPDPVSCAKNCALEGVNYVSDYGITAGGSSVTLEMYPKGSDVEGSRIYLLSDDNNYRMFKLAGQEFTFDVDLSQVPCGMNGAVYFVSMNQKGGAVSAGDKAGPAYGTGYCDAQCTQYVKFINGQANTVGWTGGNTNGRYGSCCHEMDVWEANSDASSYTPHPCRLFGQTTCDSQATGCGLGGICDKYGCDFNPYRMGNTTLYGPNGKVKTRSKFTVVTQFITDNGKTSGTVVAMRRKFVQNGRVISNSVSRIAGVRGSAINAQYCAAKTQAFDETNYFSMLGGMPSMSRGLKLGMVLTMSLWVDHGIGMRWLDSLEPPNGNPADPGVKRGRCSVDSGQPANVRQQYPNAKVTFSNIKYGDIGSTF